MRESARILSGLSRMRFHCVRTRSRTKRNRRQGVPVRAGEVIGRSGDTGRSSAPHLHFEIRHNGISIDPGTMPLTRML